MLSDRLDNAALCWSVYRVMTGGGMETELEEMQFFDKYWPGSARKPDSDEQGKEEDAPVSKWPRVTEKGEGKNRETRQGKGRNPQGGHKRQSDYRLSQYSRWGSDWSGRDKDQDGDLRALMLQVQRLLLRHEDCLALIRAEYGFVMFFRIDVACSVIGPLFAAQMKWRETKDKAPETLSKPMRTTLMSCLIKELTQRLTAFRDKSQEENQKELVRMGWIKPVPGDDPCLAYLKWDSTKRAQVIDDSREAMPYSKVMATLAAMETLISIPDTLQRFHPTRPLTAEMSGAVLPFCLQTGMRTDEADRLNNHIRELAGNSCTQLIAMSLRPERAQRSTLAQMIAKHLA